MQQTTPPISDSSRRRRRPDTDLAPQVAFEPRGTVRCVGEARFRSQAARDAGCLLDVDPDVIDWSCSPPRLRNGARTLEIDFDVRRASAREFVVVDERGSGTIPEWASEAAVELGAELRVAPHAALLGPRLENAREILRYFRWRVSLSQRITVLAALDEEGTLSLVDCMSAVRHSADPMAVVAALALRRFVEIDLDSGPLGPETRVIRFPR